MFGLPFIIGDCLPICRGPRPSSSFCGIAGCGKRRGWRGGEGGSWPCTRVCLSLQWPMPAFAKQLALDTRSPLGKVCTSIGIMLGRRAFHTAVQLAASCAAEACCGQTTLLVELQPCGCTLQSCTDHTHSFSGAVLRKMTKDQPRYTAPLYRINRALLR